MITILASKIRVFVLAALLGMALGLMSPVYAESYILDLNSKEIIQISTLGGGYVYADAINDVGQVTGVSTTAAGESHVFITGPNGRGISDLGPLGGQGGGNAINNIGQIAGTFATSTTQNIDGFITGPNGVGMTDLRALHGGETFAYAINNIGQVAGVSDGHAFITGPNGVGMTDLGTLGGKHSNAFGINDTGQVVGWSDTSLNPELNSEHAFITGPNGVGMIDLGTLGGGISEAEDINEAGQVVGSSLTDKADRHAFITGPDGVGMRDLGTLGESSSTFGINDAGQVVGLASNIPSHAFITGPDGTNMTDLNSLLSLGNIVIQVVQDINNQGQISVNASVVPEPETYALLLAGLILAGIMARRKLSDVSAQRWYGG
jgi:probable HAF family extracellular repeat protein